MCYYFSQEDSHCGVFEFSSLKRKEEESMRSKRVITFAMTAALALTTVFAQSNATFAAKKIKLSSKNVRVEVGSKKKITVKNAKKTTKVTWKINRKAVAKLVKKKTISKGKKACATILGVKKGKAVLTASYKSGKKTKKLSCTIRVREKTEVTQTTQPGTQPGAPSTAPAQPSASQAPVISPSAQPSQPVKTKAPTKPPKTATPKPTPTPVTSPDAQIYKTSQAINVDGEVDARWGFADPMEIKNWTPDSETSVAQTKSAIAKILWDDNNVYVLVTVEDPEIDETNEAAYYRDSVELFFDEYNNKYEWGRGNEFQYRTVIDTTAETVGALTDKQYWDGEEIKNAIKITDTGYVAEYAIPLHKAPEEGKFAGIEVQVNDASAGSRNGTWTLFANPKAGDKIPYDSTEVFGDCQFAVKREAKVISLDFANENNRNMEVPTQFSARDEDGNILFYDAEGNVVCTGIVSADDVNIIESYKDASGNVIDTPVGIRKGNEEYADMNTESYFDNEKNEMHCKTANNAIVRFPDGRTILPGEKAEVKIKGTYEGENGFRIWLVDTSKGLSDAAATTSNQLTFTSEDIKAALKDDGTFELTAELIGSEDDKGDGYKTSDAVMVKASSWNGMMDDLVLSSVVLTVYDPVEFVEPTQAPTQAPTEAPTEAPTQAPTQAPTEAPTQAPTEAPTQAPPTQAPTQAPPTQAPTEAPTPSPVLTDNDTPRVPIQGIGVNA